MTQSHDSPVIPVGILFLAHGAPSQLSEIPGYLANIRQDRVCAQSLIDKVQANYVAIGGGSPLRKYSAQQVAAVAARLDKKKYRCYLGMRYWSPWIEETIRDMAIDGITQALSIVLAPQYSQLSVAKYQKQIQVGLALFQADITFQHIPQYYDFPPLINAFAKCLKQALAAWIADGVEQSEIAILFTAHSLPERVLQTDDPYPMQVQTTARLIAENLNLPNEQWHFCYQSQGFNAAPWLGPTVAEALGALAGQGVRRVLCFPVGFVSDHSETLYDLDIEARACAEVLGIEWRRPPALNDAPVFIDALLALIQQEVGNESSSL